MSDFLLMLWAIMGGLLMFLLSAAFYPVLGIPPAWLIGFPIVAMFYMLFRETFWGNEP